MACWKHIPCLFHWPSMDLAKRKEVSGQTLSAIQAHPYTPKAKHSKSQVSPSPLMEFGGTDKGFFHKYPKIEAKQQIYPKFSKFTRLPPSSILITRLPHFFNFQQHVFFFFFFSIFSFSWLFLYSDLLPSALQIFFNIFSLYPSFFSVSFTPPTS